MPPLAQNTIVFYGPALSGPPELVSSFAVEHAMDVKIASSVQDLLSLLNRSFPRALILDGGNAPEPALEICRSVKADAFTSTVPVVILTGADADVGIAAMGLEAGADEVVGAALSDREKNLRLALVLRRAERDMSVHPTTRLPGTVQIERDLAERMGAKQEFAICYADLDHFKEFNDRYGYNNGDRVILLLSRILRDIVRALAPGGFVGHIGGDDFIFIVPIEYLEVCCDEIVHIFDELIPFQYSEEDRKAGYFLGKDRRGSIHRIPLMTLSIGVVTNQFHSFSHTAQVSELAAEMKAYAKTLPGTVYVVDRRGTSPVREVS